MTQSQDQRRDQGNSLLAAIARLLRPLVRLLLNRGIAYKAFADIAKRVYVEVATLEFPPPQGRKQTASRVSIITGLTRKEVRRLVSLDSPGDQEARASYNRAARVTTAWLREAPFCDSDGDARALPMEGSGVTFHELVRRFSGDMTARGVLDELLRVGAVTRDDKDVIRLSGRGYVPSHGDAEKLEILGSDVAGLISTIGHNISTSAEEPFFQRKVAYDRLPTQALPHLRKSTRQKGQGLLEALDREMAAADLDLNPETATGETKRVMIGVYYWEEDAQEDTEDNSNADNEV